VKLSGITVDRRGGQKTVEEEATRAFMMSWYGMYDVGRNKASIVTKEEPGEFSKIKKSKADESRSSNITTRKSRGVFFGISVRTEKVELVVKHQTFLSHLSQI